MPDTTDRTGTGRPRLPMAQVVPESWKPFQSEHTVATEIKADLTAKAAAPRSLVMKLTQVMAAVDRIAKRGHNDHFNYDFATEADVSAAIRSELATRHLLFVPDVQANTKNGIQTITCVQMRFAIHDGETGESLIFGGVGEGADSGDKGVYKAITGAVKFALMKLFLIPTGDDPERTDKDKPQKTAPKAQATPRLSGTALAPETTQQPVPANVDPQTGEDYGPPPEGAHWVMRYEKDGDWHRGWLSGTTPHEQIEVKTKYDTGLLLKAAAEQHKPVTYSANAKGFLSKLDWYVPKKGPIASAVSKALREDEPPISDYDEDFPR